MIGGQQGLGRHDGVWRSAQWNGVWELRGLWQGPGVVAGVWPKL